MALPAGVTAATVTWGSLGDFFGNAASISVDVKPLLGGDAKHAVWSATGQSLAAFAFTTTAGAGEAAQWQSPHVDQAGWVDGSGNAFTGWSYRADATIKIGKQALSFTKFYQVMIGQTNVDLDLVPDGTVAAPSSTPVPAVLSVAGLTGVITAEALLAELDIEASSFGEDDMIAYLAANDVYDLDSVADTATRVAISPAQKASLASFAPIASPTFTGTVSGITKTMVGLGSVDNTSDLAKPISTAQAAVNAAKADLVGGLVPTSQMPPLAINETFTPASQAAMLALTAQRGDMAIRSDVGKTFVLSTDSPSTLADWKEISAANAVTSVAGKTGVVALVKADVGLNLVDNTADTAKPVSTAQQTALDLKQNKSTPQAFVNKWTGTAWTYTTEAAAIAAGLQTADAVFHIGNPGGAAPTWIRDTDVWTQG